MFGTCHHLVAPLLGWVTNNCIPHYFKWVVNILAESLYCGLTFSNKCCYVIIGTTCYSGWPFHVIVRVEVNSKYVEALYSRHNFLLNFMWKYWSLTYDCKLFHCAFSIMCPEEDLDLYKSIDRQPLISKILVYCLSLDFPSYPAPLFVRNNVTLWLYQLVWYL